MDTGKTIKRIFILYLTACITACSPDTENLEISKSLLKGSWQFFDGDSIYTEMEISDSVYFYVHSPMKIFRAEPSAYSVDSGLNLLYEEGDIWKSYELYAPDSSTLILVQEDEGRFTCKRIYPKTPISAFTSVSKFSFDSMFLARERQFSE